MIKQSTLLKQIHDVVENIPTEYNQSDWGAWNGHAYNLDCIIFVKCMVYWDWYYPEKNKAHGGAIYRSAYDWTEIGILNHCSGVSYGAFLAALPCEYLYMDGHGGFKIDEIVRNGKTYNVAECCVAASWGSPCKVIYSYVDDYGMRYEYKGGRQAGKWTAHGRLSGVEYDGITPEPTPEPTRQWSIDTLAVYIMRGKLPDGTAIPTGIDNRKTFFAKYGYTAEETQQAQDIVNHVYAMNEKDQLTSKIAMRLIAGAGGDGAAKRREWVEKEYGDASLYDIAQKKINWYFE